MSIQLSLMGLFGAGAHRGNKRSRVNPVLKKSIYGYDNNGIAIIDLAQTIKAIEDSKEFLSKLGAKKKQVLIVGTSKHIRNYVPDFASKFKNGPMPYVNSRWLGGTLTNWSTVKKTLNRLKKLDSIIENKEFFEDLARNEKLNINREREKIQKFFKGLSNLSGNRPGAVIVLDSFYNPIVVKEAEVMKIPVILLTSTQSQVLPDNRSYTAIVNTNSVKVTTSIVDDYIKSYNSGLLNAATIKPEKDKENKESNK